eukprot:Hpha_TRINITY_DN11883_c0_g1::TRINITY_DN11883_c0_g1_i1::g.2098::m.2098
MLCRAMYRGLRAPSIGTWGRQVRWKKGGTKSGSNPDDRDEAIERQAMAGKRKSQVAKGIKESFQQKIDRLQSGLVLNNNMPSRVTDIRITHKGTMDGEDRPLHPPLVMSRSKALQHANEELMDLCYTGQGPDGVHEGKLRHLKMWLRTKAMEELNPEREKQQVELLSMQREGVVVPRAQDIEKIGDYIYKEWIIKIRSMIDDKMMQVKAEETATALKHGKQVRILLNFFQRIEDSKDFGWNFFEKVQRECDKLDPPINIRQEQVAFTHKGGQYVIVGEPSRGRR